MENWREQRRTDQEVLGEAAIPSLKSLVQSIDSFVHVIFGHHVKFTELDGSDTMALSYVTKQREHMKSVSVLIDAGLHRDALLIARSMFEATGRLLWAFKSAPERPELWLWFGLILDWRMVGKNDLDGLSISAEDKQLLNEKLAQYGPNYYTDKVKKALQRSKEDMTSFSMPADPYLNDWTQKTLKSMFEELDSIEAYDWIYRESSEWAHSGPRAIFRALERADWGVSGFTQSDYRAGAIALQVACQSQLYCLSVLNDHFGLASRDNIETLFNQLGEALTSAVETMKRPQPRHAE